MAFLTGRNLSRRTVLRSAGAALALPFLDAMSPAWLSALSRQRLRKATAPHRFMACYVPNGMAMEHWTPTGEGSDFELSFIMEPLAPFKDRMLAFSGLEASWNRNHGGASGCFLTGTTRGARNNTETLADTSLDQILAREIGRETQLPSLELALDRQGNAGVCAVGLSCAYTHTISWRSPTQPLPMEHNPRAVFEKLFGDSGSTDPSIRASRLLQQKSILDAVLEQLGDLRREIGAADQTSLEQYTESVRDVERRIQMAEARIDVETGAMDQPAGVPDVWRDHWQLMFDLQFLAFQSDLTRVSTFMVGREQNARPYPEIGVSEAWHPLSHHGNNPELIAHMAKINRHHVELFSEQLARLRDTPDGDGSLLDHMTILYGCGISNSHRHSGDNLPLLVLGGGDGKLKGGRHLRYPGRPSHANLLYSLIDKFDVPVERVGGSSEALPLETLPEF